MKPENLPEEVRAVLPSMQEYYSRLEPNRVFFHPSNEIPKGIPEIARKAKVLRGYPDAQGNAWMLWYVFPPHEPPPYFGEEPPADAAIASPPAPLTTAPLLADGLAADEPATQPAYIPAPPMPQPPPVMLLSDVAPPQPPAAPPTA